jgi:hypothetical protein
VFGAVEVGLQGCGLARGKAQGADAETGAFGEDRGRKDGRGGGEGRYRLGEACGVRSVHDLSLLSHAEASLGNG